MHKYYVFQAGLLTGAPFWRLLIHDWSKFRPSEWKPYSRNFYDEDGIKREFVHKDDRTPEEEEITQVFFDAMHLHMKRNKHHWNYWVAFKGKSRDLYGLEMPEKYVREMVADWLGASKAKTGGWDNILTWYPKNKDSMILHPETLKMTQKIMLEILS